MKNPAKVAAAIRALKQADKNFDAYCDANPHITDKDPAWRRLHTAVDKAYNNPDLPDRCRDPRDRKSRRR